MKRILVFAAHPDDDIMGRGGSARGGLGYSKGELARIREEEAMNAAKVIGFQDLTCLRNPGWLLGIRSEQLEDAG